MRMLSLYSKPRRTLILLTPSLHQTRSEEGLQKEPSNAALKSGMASVKKALDSSSPFSGSENPLAGMFADPNLIGKLASNPRTSSYMADPAFVQKIRDLQSGKGKADMGNILQDQRMLAVLGVAMGVDMVSNLVFYRLIND
jgi:stress-induced-phosphoprotein 1